MKAGRLLLGILLIVLLVSMAAVSVAVVHAYRLRGEWSAVVMILDGVVLGYASLMALLGGALRKRMREVGKTDLIWLVVWSVLGPLPISLYSVFHCIKMFA